MLPAYFYKKALFTLLKERANLYCEKTHLRFSIQEGRDRVILCGEGEFSTLISWRQQYRDSVEGAVLTITYYENNCLSFDNGTFYFPGDEPRVLSSEAYVFDVDETNNAIWIDPISSTERTTQEIIKELFLWIMSKVEITKKEEAEKRKNQGR